MRESIGGAWLTGIVITFLALFAAFLTYAINYTKAFRVKDRIIQLIEENEGYTYANNESGFSTINSSNDDLLEEGSTESKIFYFIKKVGYNYEALDSCEANTLTGTEQYGYCIEKHCAHYENSDRVYYKVTSYIALTIPVINISIKIPISGETTTLYFDRSGMNTSEKDNQCYGFETIGG